MRCEHVTLTQAKKIVASGEEVEASHLLIGSKYHITTRRCRTLEDLESFVQHLKANPRLKGVAYHVVRF